MKCEQAVYLMTTETVGTGSCLVVDGLDGVRLFNAPAMKHFWTLHFFCVHKLLLVVLHLVTHAHPRKCYTNSKVRVLSEKTNSEQVRLQVFRKSLGTNFRSLNSTGNSFQQLEPATAMALRSQSVLWLGTARSPRTADLKADRPSGQTQLPVLIPPSNCGQSDKHQARMRGRYNLMVPPTRNSHAMLWIFCGIRHNRHNRPQPCNHTNTKQMYFCSTWIIFIFRPELSVKYKIIQYTFIVHFRPEYSLKYTNTILLYVCIIYLFSGRKIQYKYNTK